jgi:tetratricopeptide (TPR) repeat protein
MRIALPLSTVQRLACAMVLLGAAVAVGQVEAQSPSPSLPAAPSDDAAVRARRLDTLFVRLKVATVEEEADAIDAAMRQAVDFMGQGLPALAMPVLDDIVARAPDWAEGWNKRATVLYFLGAHDRSLADIERTLALEPRHFGALAGIGLIRIAKGEHRAALAALRRALGINPFLKERFGLIPALEREVGEKPL